MDASGENAVSKIFHCNKINSYFGIEILDLSDITKITEVQILELKKLLNEYYLVVIKGRRTWTEKEHITFTRTLGQMELPPIYSIPSERIRQEMKRVIHTKESGIQWHSDNSDKETPSHLSVFQMQEIPKNGTETFFVSLVDAYNKLPQNVIDRWSNYRVKYSSNVTHPMLWKHPYDGKNVIYFDFAFVSNISDESNNGKELPVKLYNEELQYLNDLLSNHPSNYMHDWEIGDIVIVDNYAVAHKANFALIEAEDSRILLRTTTEGVPV